MVFFWEADATAKTNIIRSHKIKKSEVKTCLKRQPGVCLFVFEFEAGLICVYSRNVLIPLFLDRRK